MTASSFHQQLELSTCTSNSYNKSATIRHHPHRHQSKEAARRRKHEGFRSFQYTRTLAIIPEDQQQNASPRPCGERNNKNADLSCTHDNNTVLTTDFWHSMRSMKKSATSVSLGSLAPNLNEVETVNDENRISTPTVSPVQVQNINDNDLNVVFDDDYDNYLGDWEL